MRYLFTILIATIAASNMFSQQAIFIPKLSGEIIVDGVIEEAIWNDAMSFDLIMQTPHFRKEPSEETDIRMFFSDKFLYASAKFFYKDIDDLSRPGKQRDYFSGNCDWFGLMLDTFNDDENMIVFSTNPNGLRFDATSMNDMANGFEDINISWNTFWDVETTIDEKGWYAEMRIPVSSLRFQVKDDTVTMGLSLYRYIPVKNESQTFPTIDPAYGDMATWKSSLAAPVKFIGIEPDLPIYITPYLIGGYEWINELNDAETAYIHDETPKLNAGLDAKIGLTNNLTLDLTVNTDFAQVEADDQQINLTRFSLYFPEKRPFFLEKSDVFNFDYLAGQNLFYSRRIGLNDGEAVPIIGGARLTGRIGTWDVGILNMQTASKDELSGENFGVIRTKKNIINPSSYIGSMFTSRVGVDGTYNYAYGLDAVVRPFGDDYLTMRWSQTFETGVENKMWSEKPSRLLLRWERRNLRGLSYDMIYTWSGKEFNPGVGFELIEDYAGVRGTIKYGWLPEHESSKLRMHNLSNTTLLLYSTVDRTLQTAQSFLTWSYNMRSGFSGNINLQFNREIVKDSLSFSDSDVPPGTYNFFDIKYMMFFKPGTRLGGMMMGDLGQFFDGWRFSVNLQPMVSLNPSLDVNPTYRFDHVNFPGREQNFTNHILGIKAIWMLNTKLSFTSFTQYNTSVDSWLLNFRFRYNPREGNDFYLVYNEGLNMNLDREIPALPRSQSRVLLAKYTYTFGF